MTDGSNRDKPGNGMSLGIANTLEPLQTDGGDANVEDGGPFTVVSSRLKKRRKNRAPMRQLTAREMFDRTMVELDTESGWMRDCIDMVLSCQHARKMLSRREDTGARNLAVTDSNVTLHVNVIVKVNVLCLGLGRPSESRDSRAQLCFLTRLCNAIRSLDSCISLTVSAFDPVFSAADIELLDDLGVLTLSANDQGKYELDIPTIVFMPHCDQGLYEALLRTNWNPSRLGNLLLIGNQLAEYAINTPSAKHKLNNPCVSRIVPFLDCTPLPQSATYPNAFNNTAIQFVPSGVLPPLPPGYGSRSQPGPVVALPLSERIRSNTSCGPTNTTTASEQTDTVLGCADSHGNMNNPSNNARVTSTSTVEDNDDENGANDAVYLFWRLPALWPGS